MRYYPVFLDLRGLSCLVVGEGRLADEKAAALERAGAVVRRIPVFEEENADNSWLIIAVTGDPAEAQRLRDYSRRTRTFLNVVDQTEYCSVIAPAVVEQEDLLIAISTSGKCPALASRIRRELEGRYGPEYAHLLRALGEIRPAVKKKFDSFDQRKAFYHRVLDMNLIQTLKEHGAQGLRETLRDALGD